MKINALLKVGLATARAGFLGARTPFNVALSLTNRCNLNCIYCNYNSRSQQELTTEQIFRLIDEMVAAGVQRVGIFGGEPLVRDDIVEIVSYAYRKKLFISLITNGMLLYERMDVLRHLDLLIVSLDGPQEIHEFNRGEGTFKKAIEAIQFSQRLVRVWTITTFTKHNIGCAEYIVRLASSMRFGATFQFLYHNRHLGRNHEDLAPRQQDCVKAIQTLISLKKQKFPVVSSMYYLKLLLQWSDFSKTILYCPLRDLKCAAGRFYCSVDTDGTVYPCSILIEDYEGKNFLTHSFAHAFYNLEKPKCFVCLSSCMIEHSLLFSLHIGGVLDQARHILGVFGGKKTT